MVQSLLITRHIPRCNILTKNACNREYAGSEAGAPCPHYPHAPSSDLLPLRLSILARNQLVQAESDTKLEGCEDLLLRYSKFDLPKYPHSCFHRLVLLASGQDKLQSRTIYHEFHRRFIGIVVEAIKNHALLQMRNNLFR